MNADVRSIKPTNPYTIRRVVPKRDHEGKKDYPHQDANGFAEELGERLEGEPPPRHDDPRPGPPRAPRPPAEKPEPPPPAGGHLDVEA